MNPEGIIRKISIGDLKQGITYKVGQEMLGGKIVIKSILLDPESTISLGSSKYNIMVQEEGSDVIRLWKSFIGMPVAIEYDIKQEEYV